MNKDSKSIINKILRNIPPRSLGHFLACLKILEIDYGHLRSTFKYEAIDNFGHPIPWYTYPAIEYIKQLDFSNKTVFEYGSGNSSLFWAGIAKSVISIEENEHWYKKLTESNKYNNLEIYLIQQERNYFNKILDFPYNFDVVIIDGIFNRYECAKIAINKLNRGGFIILDNSDWYVETSAFLRDFNLIEIDMAGFTPINGYTSTTSFFLHREFNFQPKFKHQPKHSIGALTQYANELM